MIKLKFLKVSHRLKSIKSRYQFFFLVYFRILNFLKKDHKHDDHKQDIATVKNKNREKEGRRKRKKEKGKLIK